MGKVLCNKKFYLPKATFVHEAEVNSFHKNKNAYLLTGVFLITNSLNHGTVIRTEIAFKKISCYLRDSDCRWFIVKKAKIF